MKSSYTSKITVFNHEFDSEFESNRFEWALNISFCMFSKTNFNFLFVLDFCFVFSLTLSKSFVFI